MLKIILFLLIYASCFLTKTYALECNNQGIYSVATVTDLRIAIDCGNTDGLNTQIDVAAGTYNLSEGQIDITEKISITGATAETTILDAGGVNRHFFVSESAANLVLENLTLQNGYADKNYGGAIYIVSYATATLNNSILNGNIADYGGAISIDSYSTLNLDHSTLHSNTAKYGGAIDIRSSTVDINNSVLNGNVAFYYGGAIYVVYATMTVNNTSFSGNIASQGGATWVYSSRVDLASSTLNGNTASEHGGAMLIYYDASVSLNSNTFSENTASNGGAIFTYSYSKTNLNNTTFSGNLASNGDSIYSAYYSSIELRNTILNATKNCYKDSNSVINSSGYNLTTDSSCNFMAEGDQQNIDPMLDVLADNGGPTMTHALLEGSPAIDAGHCTNSEGYTVETDQRDYGRPVGVTCDSGSYEYGASAEEALTATLKKKCYIQDDGSYSTGCDGTRTEKGKVTYTLLWDGFTDSTVDIWVDGSIYLSATTNDEAEFITLTQDYIASTFKVCEVGTSVCSNEVQELMATTGMQTGTTDGQDGQRQHR